MREATKGHLRQHLREQRKAPSFFLSEGCVPLTKKIGRLRSFSKEKKRALTENIRIFEKLESELSKSKLRLIMN